MSLDIRALKRTALHRYLAGVVVLGILFFLPAGSLRYWEAWVYMALLFIPMGLVFSYLVRKDPGLLARRLKVKEEEEEQQTIQKVGSIFYLAMFLLPGLDHRFGWSEVPLWLVVLSDFIVLAGYLFFFRVLLENSFAARVVEVSEQQRLVTTGPYSLVRHPMYLAVSLMFLATPPALGSWWALIPVVFIILLLAVRIGNEEEVLVRDLPGYEAYRERTRYRLVPGLW